MCCLHMKETSHARTNKQTSRLRIFFNLMPEYHDSFSCVNYLSSWNIPIYLNALGFLLAEIGNTLLNSLMHLMCLDLP